MLTFILLLLFICVPLFSVKARESIDQESPQKFIPSLRLRNSEKIIIGHLNINSIPNKICLLGDMIYNRVHILLVSETKIDSVFQTHNFDWRDTISLSRSIDLLIEVGFSITFKMTSSQNRYL